MENKNNQLSINVRKENEVLVVTSREVAENFAKEHDDVLRSIRDLIKNLTTENFGVKIYDYFIESEYKNSRGRMYPEFLITEEGFSLLAMGFTGTKALQYKIAYINEFKRMKTTLNKIIMSKEESLQLAIVKANSRTDLLQAVNELDSFRKEQIAVRDEIIEKSKDDVEMARKITEADNAYDIGVFSRLLNIKGLGRNNFYGYLRSNQILMKNNVPYQKYMNYFRVIAIENAFQNSKTLIRVNGIKYIIKKLIQDDYLEETFNVDRLIEELEKEHNEI